MALAHGATIRHYVDVIARWRDDGRIVPLAICWADGRTFSIDRVVGNPQSNAFPGSDARILRYTVQIGEKITQVYLEQDKDATRESARWFVESPAGYPLWQGIRG